MTADIKHHLTDDLLMGYSAGALPEAFNVVVATHISLCDECRARLASFDAVGGSVVESMDAVAMGDDSLAAVMAMIETTPDAPANVPTPRTSSIIPTPLQEYVNGNMDAVKWRKIGGGVSQAILPTSKDATVRLLKIPAGTAVPDHGHRGMELTLVLQGACCLPLHQTNHSVLCYSLQNSFIHFPCRRYFWATCAKCQIFLQAHNHGRL